MSKFKILFYLIYSMVVDSMTFQPYLDFRYLFNLILQLPFFFPHPIKTYILLKIHVRKFLKFGVAHVDLMRTSTFLISFHLFSIFTVN